MLAESLQMSEQGKRVMVCAFLVLDYRENFIKNVLKLKHIFVQYPHLASKYQVFTHYPEPNALYELTAN